MSVKVVKGETYPAKGMKSGIGKKGAWALLSVKAEKGYDKIDIWASNPEDVKDASAVKILDIEDVAITNQRSQDGTKWFTHYSVSAKLAPVAGRSKGGDEWVSAEDDLEDIFKL